MKLIYYSPHPTHDIVTEVGYATHQRETIEALKQLGVEVLPVIMGGTSLSEIPYHTGKALEHKGLKGFLKKIIPRYIWVSLKDWKLMKHDKLAAQKLEKAILDFQPDIVYERSEYLQNASVAVLKKHNVKYYIEVNSPFVEEMIKMEGKTIWNNLAHQKEENKYKSANKVFVVSTVLKDFLIKKYRINSEKIIVSPNRINEVEFLSKAKLPPIITPKFKNENLPIVGFVGSILPHHYLDTLILAFKKVLESNNKANLLIVGGGQLLEKMKKLSIELIITDHVFFTDKIAHEHVPAFINLMDICVMPGSNWYGSPIKIFEYGILGKAVIAPDNDPVKDVMQNEKDGLLVNCKTDLIAQAIIKLIQNNDMKIELGQNFKSKILENYTWKKAAELILSA